MTSTSTPQVDLYRRQSVPLLPGLQPRTAVQGGSGLALRFAPMGAVNALAELLAGSYELRQARTQGEGELCPALYARKSGRDWSRLVIGDQLHLDLADDEDAAALLLLATRRGLAPILGSAWEAVTAACGAASQALPTGRARLRELTSALTGPLLLAADSAAYFLTQAQVTAGPGVPARDAPGEASSVDVRQAFLAALPLPDAERPAGPALLGGPLLRDLTRWLSRGLNVLLTGPTAAFKTTYLDEAAEALGLAVVSVAGRPGMEDRDFYGGVYPLMDGPGWVDGPVTTAFRLACGGARTLLAFNEVTRFEPLYFNAMVGLMDERSGAQLRSNGIEFSAEQLRLLGLARQEDARYYLLELPNGERLPCPTHLLSVAGTANLGADYVTTGELDAALLRRFHRQREVTHPDLERVLPLLIRAAGGDEHLARVAHELEVFTRSEVLDADDMGSEQGPAAPGSGEGLLKRSMNFSVTQALLSETADLGACGMAMSAAFVQAAESTVVPYCAPRTRGGLLDPVATRRLRDDVQRFSARLDT